MAFLKADSSKASTGFEVLPAGQYECFIESGAVKTYSTGSTGIEFKLKVRDDVEGQKYGGRALWGKLFFTANTEGVVQGFVKAIGTPDGHEFESEDDLKDYAIGRAILAQVKVTQYKGEDRNEVSYMNESKVGGGKIDNPLDIAAKQDPFADTSRTDNDPFAAGGGPIEINDDDLPF
jgi:hypothetical protein